jgi:hypothetical protein
VNQRDTLSGLTESDGRSASHLELDPVDHEEPTWDMRQAVPRRRFDRRARMILSAAAVAALLANAGAAWAYWRFNSPPEEDRWPAAGVSVEVSMTATSDPTRPLRAGAEGNLTVAVTNQHPASVRILSITAGPGRVVADDAHREAGCVNPRVQLTRETFPVSWEVPKNTIGAFILPGALIRQVGGPAACQGATFTVPVRANAVRP